MDFAGWVRGAILLICPAAHAACPQPWEPDAETGFRRELAAPAARSDHSKGPRGHKKSLSSPGEARCHPLPRF